MKEIVIYLGSKCNLNCYYCHREESQIENNISDKLLELVKEPCKISFKGGEPLLYINEIKKIVNASPYSDFVITTNGILFNKYKNYLKKHNFLVCLSYDGEKSLRKYNPLISPIDYPRLGVVTTLYHDNCDLEKIINDFEKRLLIIGKTISLYPHIMHPTNNINSKFALTKEDYQNIIKQYKYGINEYIKYIEKFSSIYLRYRGLYLSLYNKLKYNFKYGETFCANNNIIRVDWNGNHFNCAYIRDVLLNKNWKNTQIKIIENLSKKCINCSVYSMCGAGCVKSRKHNLECKFYYELYSWFKDFYETNKDILNSVEKKENILIES